MFQAEGENTAPRRFRLKKLSWFFPGTTKSGPVDIWKEILNCPIAIDGKKPCTRILILSEAVLKS